MRMRFDFLLLFSWLLLYSLSFGQNLKINEFVASNFFGLSDEDEDFEDWIEILNTGTSPINLSGYGLSDNVNNLFKWQFPPVEIQAGEFLIVFASGKDRTQPNLHTNFSISSSGEDLLITNPSGVIIDFISAVEVPRDFSYGRYQDGAGSLFYFNSPTPGAPNSSENYSELIPTPNLSYESGFYVEPIEVQLTNTQNGVNYHYTLDGSEPTTTDPVFPTSLLIEDISENEDNISLIPTTPSTAPDWFKWFPPMGNVFKGTNLRVKGFSETGIAHKSVTRNFFVNEEIFSKFDIPVVAISVDPDDLFSPSSGIYANFHQRDRAWERKANIHYFEPDGTIGFKTDMGLRIHGGNSRRYALKSFRLYFRNAFGKNTIDYPILKDKDFNQHQRLILRNSGSDWSRTYFRDAFVQNILHGFSDVEFQGFQPTVSFVNGEFWGLLNFRGRYDDNYLQLKYGIEELDLLETTGSVVYGSNSEYTSLTNFLQSNDLNVPENYEEVKSRMDVENFCDYHILQIFSMNTDQPGKNVRFWKSNELDNKWRWMWFDLDDSFLYGPHCSYDRNGFVFNTGLNTISSTTINPASNNPVWAPNGPLQTAPLRNILGSDEFKTYFINRFGDLLNTAFEPAYLFHKIDSIYSIIEPYMEQHYRRWYRPEPEFHEEHLEYLYLFSENRQAYTREQLVDFFELSGDYELTVDVASGEGYIHLNTIAIDTITPTITSPVYPWKGIYFNDVPIKLKAIPREGYAFSHWDGLVFSTEDEIEVSAAEAIYLEAHFLPSDSINSVSDLNHINCTLYPNPTNGVFTLEIGDESLVNGTISITNLNGIQSIELPIMQAATSIDLSSFPAGVYLVTITTQNKEAVRKKIVKL